jgi:hypothetical protein
MGEIKKCILAWEVKAERHKKWDLKQGLSVVRKKNRWKDNTKRYIINRLIKS